MTTEQTLEQIQGLVGSDRIVLFMKGNRSFPQCGFSATVVQILDGLGAEYRTINVLSDPDIRQGVKDFSKWPTIPQLYVEGEFVGGCDIVREMFSNGELQTKLGLDISSIEPPAVTVSDGAKQALTEALSEAEDGEVLLVSIDAKFEHSLGIGPAGPGTITVEVAGLTLGFDAASARRAGGLSIDFIEQDGTQGFKIENPNAPPKVEQLSAPDLKAKLDSGEVEHLFDVRTPGEREKATIEGAVHLDDAAMSMIETLDKDTTIAFYCHRGIRSQSAAEHFRDKGFRKIYNLAGGITAWSAQVDPKVPTY